MKYLLVMATLVLAGCYQPPDPQELKSQFLSHQDSIETLQEMIKEDIRDRDCFAIGKDRIGDFWEYDDLWSRQSDYSRKVSLETVLAVEGIESTRYEIYLDLLGKLQAERIGFCKDHHDGWTRVIVGTAGLGVSGTMITFESYEDSDIPETDIQESYSTEIHQVSEKWFIQISST